MTLANIGLMAGEKLFGVIAGYNGVGLAFLLPALMGLISVASSPKEHLSN